jgi:hypothetical protein
VSADVFLNTPDTVAGAIQGFAVVVFGYTDHSFPLRKVLNWEESMILHFAIVLRTMHPGGVVLDRPQRAVVMAVTSCWFLP